MRLHHPAARDLDVSQLESLQSLSLLLSGPRQVGPVPDSGDLGKDLLRQLERLTQARDHMISLAQLSPTCLVNAACLISSMCSSTRMPLPHASLR